MINRQANVTKNDQASIDDFIEMQIMPDNKFTFCGYHGKQKAIGNHDECEQCLIEYKQTQIF